MQAELQRLSVTLEKLFAQANAIGANYLFCYLNSIDEDYEVKAIAKQENDIVLIKHKNQDFIPIDQLHPLILRQLKLGIWAVQHVFHSRLLASLTVGYCWCGCHQNQHKNPCETFLWDEFKSLIGSHPLVTKYYSRIESAEIMLHEQNVCSNPTGCGL